MEKKVALLIVALLSTSLICGARFFAMQPDTHVYPDDFPNGEGGRLTLQEAIWNVSDGDEIDVKPDTYYVHLDVNNSITIRGFDKDTTILDGSDNGTVIHIRADNVKIRDFTVRNGDPYGISFDGSASHCNVSSNTIINNYYGIKVSGSSQALRDNNIRNNVYNIGVGGLHDIDYSNTVDNKHVCYCVNQQNIEIPKDLGYEPGYVALINCANITVEDMLLAHNGQGVLVSGSTNITLQNLTLTYDVDGISFSFTSYSRIENISAAHVLGNGIYLSDSNNNLICESTLLDAWNGIELISSQNNTLEDNNVVQSRYLALGIAGDDNVIAGNNLIDNYCGVWAACNGSLFYHNNFIRNPDGYKVWSGCFNLWNLTLEGNYWDDVGGADNDHDGIDEFYNKTIDVNNIDFHPLNETWTPLRRMDATWLLFKCSDPQLCANYTITILSDHVVASYQNYRLRLIGSRPEAGLVVFNVTFSSPSGFCNVTMPRDVIDTPFEVFVDGREFTKDTNYTLTYNETHASIYFTYEQGVHNIEIIGRRASSFYSDIDGNGLVNMGDINAALDYFGESLKKRNPP